MNIRYFADKLPVFRYAWAMLRGRNAVESLLTVTSLSPHWICRLPSRMKNVTITLDEKTAAWARVYAAEHNMSVSRMVGEMLARRMSEMREYDRAMRTFLAKKPVKLTVC